MNRRRTSSASQSPITQSSGVDGQRDVGDDLRELLVERQALGARLDVLLLLALELIGVGEELLDRAELVDSFAAVLSPTPGTPGMLSLVSPFSATKSRYWLGVMPNRSVTAASS